MIIERSEPGANRLIKPTRPLDRKLAEQMIAHFRSGQFRTLAQLARQVTRQLPGHPSGWHFLGVALRRLGEPLEGLRALLKANDLFPGDPQLLGHLGGALASMGYSEEADGCFRCGLANQHPARRTQPVYLETLRNYVTLKVGARQYAEAERLARELVELVPEDGHAYFAMAQVCLATRRIEQAIQHLETVIRLSPGMMDAYQDLGLAYFQAGRLADSLHTTELAIARNPDAWQAFSNLLFFLSHDEKRSPDEVFRRHCEFGERYESALRKTWRPHDNDRDPERRLRIGFVSADFCAHAVASFIEPILINLDRSRFDLYGFHNTDKFDRVTRRLKDLFKIWVSVAHVSDQDLAEIIRVAKIDILIDLSGHTAGSALMAFARKPAPIQAHWIGYPNTTGLQSMDYQLLDRYIAPEGMFDDQFTEKLVRLPSNGTFRYPDSFVDVGPLRALENGHVTFGSFNRLGKVTASTLDLWARVLQACPTARMLIGAVPSDAARDNMIAEFERRGIPRGRLTFESRKPTQDYLALHRKVDMILDTVPYPGGTTSNIALWMGVPVLTMAVPTRAGRVGVGIVLRVGLDDFVAVDEEDFIRRACEFAQAPERLAEIRAGMRDRIRNSRNQDIRYVTRGVETAFRMMWRRWCAGEPPAAITVPV